MKTVIIVCTFVGTVLTRPNTPTPADIIRYDYDSNGFGKFSFEVDTSDGFHHDATGHLENIGTGREELVVTGSYSYTGSDGVKYTVDYIADSNGFQPTGKHLTSVGVHLQRRLPLSSTEDLTKSALLSSTDPSRQTVPPTTITATTPTTTQEVLPPLQLGELCLTCQIPHNSNRQ
ncbi:hypothetical protein NQ318_003339 [Aromia moschata]|uniref:Uncharacterized protein n=1 Tax=Aromia moschata TaxID=1265417 RepID=A0AAV8XGC8_9CUCU|nr:hypothetical protein NQ318_003339 [Aromia moschata]